MTHLLLDSGDPEEYKEISQIAKAHGQELWGSTTNPSLIAKKLSGQKVSFEDAFSKLQREIVMEILDLVPGAVSAEVYASSQTTAEEMVEQGRQIASWHPRVVVKLPTTLEGLKARNILRREGIVINNTLVFSQQQVFAITQQEKLILEDVRQTQQLYPCFISPFVGRLDDIGQNGMSFVRNSIQMLENYFPKDLVWMLAASIRTVEHLKASLDAQCELMTVPAGIYKDWFALSQEKQQEIDYHSSESKLTDIPVWTPSDQLLHISSTDELLSSVSSGELDISHQLTTKGIEKFVADWQQILI